MTTIDAKREKMKVPSSVLEIKIKYIITMNEHTTSVFLSLYLQTFVIILLYSILK